MYAHLKRKFDNAVARGDLAAASIVGGQMIRSLRYDDMQTAIDAEEPLLLSDARPPQFEIVFDQGTKTARLVAV